MDDREENEPTAEEIREVTRKLKNNKSAGLDGVEGELLKYGMGVVTDKLESLICRVWREETIPEDWRAGITVPIHKKKDRMECSNYRGISLLSAAYKVYTGIIYRRLKRYSEEIIGEYQGGFRTGRSTIDQIFVLRQILEKTWEYRRDNWHLFIDFRKAYDSVRRGKLWSILREFRVPEKLIRLIKDCYKGDRGHVRVGGELTDSYEANTGLRQGCILSTVLFNLVLEWIIRKTNRERGLEVGYGRVWVLAYADDVDIMAESAEELQRVAVSFVRTARETGLEININKTKVLRAGRGAGEEGEIYINGEKVEEIENFKYLGGGVTSRGTAQDEVHERIAAGSRSYFGLKDIFRCRALTNKIKVEVYKVMVRPVVMYNMETMCMTREMARKLDVFERKVLRKIYGPVFDGGEGRWRRRHNVEVMELSGLIPLSEEIRAAKMRWAGHVARMEEDRMPQRAMNWVPNGRRPRGRPRQRWEDGVREIVGDDWRGEALDRRSWRVLVEEAMSREAGELQE